MARALHHRGPDEDGIYRDDHCGLAHTRLAILDVAGGKQPLHDSDHDAHLAFNGEIFNYKELRRELQLLGYRFHTRSDTEVVLHALQAWGERALERFNGQFAIAFWTPRTRRLLLARDRFGVRPLHICTHMGRVYFASEIKSIFAADPTIPRALDPAGLVETFTFWTVLAPRTTFRAVEELRPGHVRVYEPEGMREHCYWSMSFPEAGKEHRSTVEEATEALRSALTRATARRLECADVQVACYLSGGIDSSVIAALARRIHGRGLRTFSLRFADAELDEGPFQRLMARELDTDHTELEVSRADIAEVFPTAIRHIERPILRTAPVPMMLLAQRVRTAGIKVVLTGEGADEMLAGYDLFREARVRRFWSRQPHSPHRPRLLERLYPYLARSPSRAQAMAREFFRRGIDAPDNPLFAHSPRWAATSALQRLLSREVLQMAAASGDPIERLRATLPPEFGSWDPLARDQYVEARTLLSGYLLSSQGDRVAMANSVEGRFPFLDADVVALASSLSPDHKLKVLDEKHVLKRVAAGLVPPSIIQRPKQPYRAPDAIALCSDPLREWVSAALDEKALRDSGLFDAAAVAQLWKKCRSGDGGTMSNTDNMALTGVLSTQLLAREIGHT